MQIDAFAHAQRYVGIRELSAQGEDHPLIQWWLSLCGYSLHTPDEVPWCSAFVNGIAWALRLPRSKSAAARSWLTIGQGISPAAAQIGYDVVVLTRGGGEQPGPEVIQAQGHVGFFGGWQGQQVLVLGGNQGNSVSLEAFPAERILGVRRIL